MKPTLGSFIFACAVSLTLCLAESGYAQSNTFPASGNVGIGTTSPTMPLDANNGSTTGTIIRAESTSNPTIQILDNSGSNGALDLSISTLPGNFSNFASAGDAVVRTGLNAAGAGANLDLTCRTATGGIKFGTGIPDTVKMIVTNAGNVGIGTTAPAATLDVNGGIRAGSSTVVTTCNSSAEGTQRYNYTSHGMEYCNGTGWMAVGAIMASGTWCGYYDSLASNLVSACSGSNPSSSCPSGYNQIVIQASGGSTAGYTCIHN